MLYSSNIRPHSPFEVKAKTLPPPKSKQRSASGDVPVDFKRHVSVEDKPQIKEETSFSFHRSVWEKRSQSQAEAEAIRDTSRVSSSRDFWEQQSKLQKQKQTPDLVMDLPILGTSPKNGDSPQGSPKILDSENHEEPIRPAIASNVTTTIESPDMTSADRFATTSQCTLKKNSATTSKQCSNDAETQTAEKTNSQNTELKKSNSIPVKSEVVTITGVGSRTPKMTSKYTHFSQISTDNASASEISSFKPQAKLRPTVKKKPALPLKPSPEISRKFSDGDSIEISDSENM